MSRFQKPRNEITDADPVMHGVNLFQGASLALKGSYREGGGESSKRRCSSLPGDTRLQNMVYAIEQRSIVSDGCI